MKLLGKINRALKVVEYLEKRLPEGQFYCETYSNGREQGFAIRSIALNSKVAIFSENRNSGDMVLYFGFSGYTGSQCTEKNV